MLSRSRHDDPPHGRATRKKDVVERQVKQSAGDRSVALEHGHFFGWKQVRNHPPDQPGGVGRQFGRFQNGDVTGR